MSGKMASCIFCKIIKGMCTPPHFSYLLTNSSPGEIPCFKLFESDKTLAFLDINPLSKGHAVFTLPLSPV